jgi:hypothetical protein
MSADDDRPTLCPGSLRTGKRGPFRRVICAICRAHLRPNPDGRVPVHSRTQRSRGSRALPRD